MTAITSAEITSGVVGGTGIFDVLMASVEQHLIKEYEAGRITGADYTNVYLNAMTAAMTQSTQYVLGKQAADKQADLLEQQRINAVTQNTTMVKQNAKLDAEIALLTQKKFTEEAQILDTVNQQSVAGTVGAQKTLLAKQTAGFDRDAEHKILQVLANTWSVRHTGDNTLTTNAGSSANGLSNENIKSLLNAALTNINVTPAA